jgi:predicted HAD superfamily Cof-like phosphohydrolase
MSNMPSIMPAAGTTAYDDFMRKARNPESPEGKMMSRIVSDEQDAVQGHVRQLLHKMISLVEGQLFRDVAIFHEKFQLSPTDDPGHRLPEDVVAFRIKFMREELEEYCEAVGAVSGAPCQSMDRPPESLAFGDDAHFPEEGRLADMDAEKAFDALLDLAYVCLGTAFLHRFPWNAGWSRVQAANLSKVRAESSDDPLSHRKHRCDVVKPAGFKPPVLTDLLDEPCDRCYGAGACLFDPAKDGPDIFPGAGTCPKCQGTGRQRRAAPNVAKFSLMDELQ